MSAKNGKQLAEGMVINLQVAFQGLPAPKGKKDETYALQLIDTVKVGKEGGLPLTGGDKSLDAVCFFMGGVRPTVPAKFGPGLTLSSRPDTRTRRRRRRPLHRPRRRRRASRP